MRNLEMNLSIIAFASETRSNFGSPYTTLPGRSNRTSEKSDREQFYRDAL